jgi:hypothetical protein
MATSQSLYEWGEGGGGTYGEHGVDGTGGGEDGGVGNIERLGSPNASARVYGTAGRLGSHGVAVRDHTSSGENTEEEGGTKTHDPIW